MRAQLLSFLFKLTKNNIKSVYNDTYRKETFHMTITNARAKQIIQEELRRALRARGLNETHGHMADDEGAHPMDDEAFGHMEDETYDMDDESTMDEEYDMDDEGYSMDDESYDMEDEGYDMEEGQHDNDSNGQHDNDMGPGDDILVKEVRRRLAAARPRR
jgi:hypothetical protein